MCKKTQSRSCKTKEKQKNFNKILWLYNNQKKLKPPKILIFTQFALVTYKIKEFKTEKFSRPIGKKKQSLDLFRQIDRRTLLLVVIATAAPLLLFRALTRQHRGERLIWSRKCEFRAATSVTCEPGTYWSYVQLLFVISFYFQQTKRTHQKKKDTHSIQYYPIYKWIEIKFKIGGHWNII